MEQMIKKEQRQGNDDNNKTKVVAMTLMSSSTTTKKKKIKKEQGMSTQIFHLPVVVFVVAVLMMVLYLQMMTVLGTATIHHRTIVQEHHHYHDPGKEPAHDVIVGTNKYEPVVIADTSTMTTPETIQKILDNKKVVTAGEQEDDEEEEEEVVGTYEMASHAMSSINGGEGTVVVSSSSSSSSLSSLVNNNNNNNVEASGSSQHSSSHLRRSGMNNKASTTTIDAITTDPTTSVARTMRNRQLLEGGEKETGEAVDIIAEIISPPMGMKFAVGDILTLKGDVVVVEVDQEEVEEQEDGINNATTTMTNSTGSNSSSSSSRRSVTATTLHWEVQSHNHMIPGRYDILLETTGNDIVMEPIPMPWDVFGADYKGFVRIIMKVTVSITTTTTTTNTIIGAMNNITSFSNDTYTNTSTSTISTTNATSSNVTEGIWNMTSYDTTTSTSTSTTTATSNTTNTIIRDIHPELIILYFQTIPDDRQNLLVQGSLGHFAGGILAWKNTPITVFAPDQRPWAFHKWSNDGPQTQEIVARGGTKNGLLLQERLYVASFCQPATQNFHIRHLTLLNTDTKEIIQSPLRNNSIFHTLYTGSSLSILAETTGCYGESVVFHLDSVDRYQIENYEPFLLGGNIKDVYNPTPEIVVPGQHTVSATVYSKKNGNGISFDDETSTISFNMVDDTAMDFLITDLVLVNTITKQDIATIRKNGDIISLDEIGKHFTIRANTIGDTIDYIVFELFLTIEEEENENDVPILLNTDNESPYLLGDNQVLEDQYEEQVTSALTTSPGNKYKLISTPYSITGQQGVSVETYLTIVSTEKARFF